MMDLVTKTKRAPEAGETIIGENFQRFPGGKGANQAVAAARLGGNVVMSGKLGADTFGEDMFNAVHNEGVDTSFIVKDPDHSTGIGTVVIEENGENRIVVVPGANLHYTIDDLSAAEHKLSQSSLLMMQLEMDLGLITEATHRAHAQGVPVILNPAPAQLLSDDLLSHITYLTPNETELEILSGKTCNNLNDYTQAAELLLEKGVKHVIVTMAEAGSLIVTSEGSRHIPTYPVKAIDTVAAGDAFNGALAAGIAKGEDLDETVRKANAVGALAVMKSGAIPSLPTQVDLKDFLDKIESV